MAHAPPKISYAGPQGTPGLDQINIRLLPELQRTVFVGNSMVTQWVSHWFDQ